MSNEKWNIFLAGCITSFYPRKLFDSWILQKNSHVWKIEKYCLNSILISDLRRTLKYGNCKTCEFFRKTLPHKKSYINLSWILNWQEISWSSQIHSSRTLLFNIFQSLLIKNDKDSSLIVFAGAFFSYRPFHSIPILNFVDERILSFRTLDRKYTSTIQSLCRCETSVSNREWGKKVYHRMADKGSQPSDFVGKATPQISTEFLYIPPRVSASRIYLRYSRRLFVAWVSFEK